MSTKNPPLWQKELRAAITVCDRKGIILEMNDRSVDTFKRYGGKKLLGKNVLLCHPEKARKKLVKMFRLKNTNAYTIEKNGIKKLIYQAPWFKKGVYQGFVEISLPIPKRMPHFKR